ncbi:MAG: formylglycine-generating enzyme family protein, partial [Cyanobacteria bacterium J06638_6]
LGLSNGVFAHVETGDIDLILRVFSIPSGTFFMGSPDNELDRQDREDPQYEVNIPSFYMGKYPITQAQWEFVARLPAINLELSIVPSQSEGSDLPVEQISWFEAVEFCDRLARHTNRPYRLPTEAEWEYACRANTTTPFHFGETITTDLANYNGADEQHGAYGRGPRGVNRQMTTPVDHFGIANAFGLCDMHGNVWEWCQDPWRPTYDDGTSQRKAKTAPQPDQSNHRVARGGSWYTTPKRCRSASRIHFAPESRHPDVGFRVVCALEK